MPAADTDGNAPYMGYSSEDDEVEISHMTERHKRKLEALLAQPIEWSEDEGDEDGDDEGGRGGGDGDSDDDDGCGRSRQSRPSASTTREDETAIIASSRTLLRPYKNSIITDRGKISFLDERSRSVNTSNNRSLSSSVSQRRRRNRGDSTDKTISDAVKKDQSFSLRELKKLRKIFEAFDEDGGMIFRVFVEKVGPIIRHKASGATLHDMEVLFKRIDANANGSVDWFEISDFLLMNDVKTSARAMGGAANPQLFERQPISRHLPTDHAATRFLYHTEPATRLLINHTYGHYYTSSTDGMAKMWSPDTLRHERTFHCSKSPIVDMAQTTWGDSIAVLAMDGTASFYDPDKGELIRVYRAEKRREVGLVGGKGVVDDRRGYIHRPVFTVPISAQEMEEIRYGDHTKSFGKIDACTPYLSHFVKDQCIETVGLENLGWLPRTALQRGHTNPADLRGTSSVVHYDPVSHYGNVGTNASNLTSAGYVSSVAAFTDARAEKPSKAIFGLESGHVQLYDLDPASSFGLPIAIPNRLTLGVHTGAVSSIKVCESMNLVFTASHDGTLQVRHWDRLEDYGVRLGEGAMSTASTAAGNSVVEEFQPSYVDIAQRGHTRRITGMDWSLRSRLLASCAPERDALLWSPYLPKPIMKLEGEPMTHLLDIRFCDEVGQVMTLASNRTVKLWDMRTFRCLHTLRDGGKHREKEGLKVAAFDKRKSAVVLGTTYPRQWLVVQSNKYADTYAGHKLPVIGMVLSTQFGQLITADEKYIIVWDAVYQTVIVRWRVSEGVTGIALDSNGRRLLVSTLQGNILVYNYVNAQLLKQCAPDRPLNDDVELAAQQSLAKESAQRVTKYERTWVQVDPKEERAQRRRKIGNAPEKSAEAEAAAALAPESEHEAKGHEWEVDVKAQLIIREDLVEDATGGGGGAFPPTVRGSTVLTVSKKQETRFVCFGEILQPHRHYYMISCSEGGTASIYADNDSAITYPMRTVDVRPVIGNAYCAAVVASLLVLGSDGTLACHAMDDTATRTYVMPLLSEKADAARSEAVVAKGGQHTPLKSTHLLNDSFSHTSVADVSINQPVQDGSENGSRPNRSAHGARPARERSIGRMSMAASNINGVTPTSPKGTSPKSKSAPRVNTTLVAMFPGRLTQDPSPANQKYLGMRDEYVLEAKALAVQEAEAPLLPDGTPRSGGFDLEAQRKRQNVPSIDCMAVITAVAPFVIVTGSSDGLLQFWSGRSLSEIYRFRATLVGGDAVTAITPSVDGRFLAVGDSSGYISVIDMSRFVRANADADAVLAMGFTLSGKGESPFVDAGLSTRRAPRDSDPLKDVSAETVGAFAYVGQVRQAKITNALAMIEAKQRKGQGKDGKEDITSQSRWALLPDIVADDTMFTLQTRFRAHDGSVTSVVRLDTSAQSDDRNVLRRDNPEAFVQERDADYISSQSDEGRLRYLYSGGTDTFVNLWDVVDVQGISCVGDTNIKVKPLPHSERACMAIDACRRQCLLSFIQAYEVGVTTRQRRELLLQLEDERRDREAARARMLAGPEGTDKDADKLGGGLVKHGRRLGTKRQEDADRKRQEESDKARFNSIRHTGATVAVLIAFVESCLTANATAAVNTSGLAPIAGTPTDNALSRAPHGAAALPTLAKDAAAFHEEDVSAALGTTAAQVFGDAIDGEASLPLLIRRLLKDMCGTQEVDHYLQSTGLREVVKGLGIGEGSEEGGYTNSTLPAELLCATMNADITDAKNIDGQPLFTESEREVHLRYLVNPQFVSDVGRLIGKDHAAMMGVVATDWSAPSLQMRAMAAAVAARGIGGRGLQWDAETSFAAMGTERNTILASRAGSEVSLGNTLGGGSPLSLLNGTVPEGRMRATSDAGMPLQSVVADTPPPTPHVRDLDAPVALQSRGTTASTRDVGDRPLTQISVPEHIIATHRSSDCTDTYGGDDTTTHVKTEDNPLLVSVGSGDFMGGSHHGGDALNATISINMLRGSSIYDGAGEEADEERVRFVVRPPKYTASGRGKVRDALVDPTDPQQREAIRNIRAENQAAFDRSTEGPATEDEGRPTEGIIRLRIDAPEGGAAERGPRDALTAAERRAMLSGAQTSIGVALEALGRGTSVVANLIMRYGTPAMKARYLPMLVGTRQEGPSRHGALCIADVGAKEHDALDGIDASLQEAREGMQEAVGDARGRREDQRLWVLKGSKVCLADHEVTGASPAAQAARKGRRAPVEGEERSEGQVIGTIFVVLVRGPLQFRSKATARYTDLLNMAGSMSNLLANSQLGAGDEAPLSLVVIDSVEHEKELKFSGRQYTTNDLLLTQVTFLGVPITRPTMSVLCGFEEGRRIAVEVMNHVRMGIPHEMPTVDGVLADLLQSAEAVALRQRQKQDAAVALAETILRAQRDDGGADVPLMERLEAAESASIISSSLDDEGRTVDKASHTSRPHNLRAPDIQLLRSLGIAPMSMTDDEADILGGDNEALLTPREKEQRRLVVRDALMYVSEKSPKKGTVSGPTTPRAVLNGGRAKVPLLAFAAIPTAPEQGKLAGTARVPGTPNASAGRRGMLAQTAPSGAQSARRPTEAMTGKDVLAATMVPSRPSPVTSPRQQAYVSSANNGDVHDMQKSMRDMRQLTTRLRQETARRGTGQRMDSTAYDRSARVSTVGPPTFTSGLLSSSCVQIITATAKGGIPDDTARRPEESPKDDGPLIAPKAGLSIIGLIEGQASDTATPPAYDPTGPLINFASDPVLAGEGGGSRGRQGRTRTVSIGPALGLGLGRRAEGDGTVDTPQTAPSVVSSNSRHLPTVTDRVLAEAAAIRKRVLDGRKERMAEAMEAAGEGMGPTTRRGLASASIGAQGCLSMTTLMNKQLANPLHAKRRFDDIVSSNDEVSGKGSLWDTSDKALAAVQGSRGATFVHGADFMEERVRDALRSEATSVAGGRLVSQGMVGVDMVGEGNPISFAGLPSPTPMLPSRRVSMQPGVGGGSVVYPPEWASAPADVPPRGQFALPTTSPQLMSRPFTAATTTIAAGDAGQELTLVSPTGMGRQLFPAGSPHRGDESVLPEDDDAMMLRCADDYFEKVLGVRILERQMEVGKYVHDRQKRALIGLTPYVLTDREREKYEKGFLMSDVLDRKEYLPTSAAANPKKLMTSSTASDMLLHRLQEQRRLKEGDPPSMEDGGGGMGIAPVARPAPNGANDPRWLTRVYSHLPLGDQLGLPPKPQLSVEDSGMNFQQHTTKEVMQAREGAWLRLLTNTRSGNVGGGSKDKSRQSLVPGGSRPNTRGQAAGVPKVPKPPSPLSYTL